jgi:hypothetical protein
MTGWRLPYTVALATWNSEAIVDQLTEDVTIRVSFHDTPVQGRDHARLLFDVLAEELSAPAVTGEIVEEATAVVLFQTSIRGAAAEGVNVLRITETGTIRELTVFIRPLQSLAVIADVVGVRMAERFGPPPE